MRKFFSLIAITALLTGILQAFCFSVFADVAIGTDIIANGGFETLSSGYPANWSGSDNTTICSASSSVKRTGSYSLRVATGELSSAGAGQIMYTNLVPGADYTFEAFGKTESGNASARCVSSYGGGASDYTSVTVSTDWMRISFTFTLPAGCTAMSIYLGNYSKGSVLYYDDVSLKLTTNAKLVSINTDQVFYYSDNSGSGTATVTPTDIYSPATGDVIDFTLKDGANILQSKANVAISSSQAASFEFELSKLSVKNTAYIVEAVLKQADGTVLDTRTQNVYKYDRPSYMTNDGFIKIDGEVFSPKIALACNSTNYYPYIKEMGYNAVTVYYGHLAGAIAKLEENNLKAVVPLYLSMKPAGNPDIVEQIKTFVNIYKDSPAVLGWQPMDEPGMNLTPVDYDIMMEASYKAIRDIDSKHPVMIVDAELGMYDKQAKYSDALLCDAYTVYNGSGGIGDTVINHMQAAVAAAEPMGKPVYYIAGTFERNGYFVSENEFRNAMWQSFFCGGKGFGLYPIFNVFENDSGGMSGAIYETDLWDDLLKIDEIGEMELAFDHFAYGKTEKFNGDRSGDYWLESWIDGTMMYIIVLNRKTSAQSVSISMTNTDGTYTINPGKAELIAGGESDTSYITNGILSAELSGSEATLYKISTDNLMINAGFEETESGADPIPGWSTYSASSEPNPIAYNTAQKHSGSRSMEISHSDVASVTLTQNVNIDSSASEGKRYRFSIYAYNINCSSRARMNYKAVYHIGNTAMTLTGSVTIPVSTTWEYITDVIRLPANTSKLSMEIFNGGPDSAGTLTTVYIDDACIEEITEDDANLMINGDLEKYFDYKGVNLPVGFVGIRNIETQYGDYLLSPEYAHSGSLGLRMNAYAQGLKSGLFNVTNKDGLADFSPGDDLTLSFYLRSNTVTRYEIQCCRTFTEGSVIPGEGTGGDIYLSSTGGEWTLVSYTFKVPEGCTYVKIFIKNYQTGYADYDDFTLKQDTMKISFINDSEEITSLTSGNVTARLRFISDITEAEGGAAVVFFAALYKKVGNFKEMCDVKKVEETVHKGAPKDIDAGPFWVPEGEEEEYFIKAFVWNTNLEPYLPKACLVSSDTP